MNRAIEATAGSVLKFGERLRGARAYVAVAGGIDVPEVLGSRSTHVLTSMGGHEGRALKAGDALRIGARGKGQGVRTITPYPLPFTPFARGEAARDALPMRACSRTLRRSDSACRRGPIGWVIDSTVPPSLMRRRGELISTAVPTGRDSGAADRPADIAHERSRDDRRLRDCRHRDYGRPSARRSARAGRLG